MSRLERQEPRKGVAMEREEVGRKLVKCGSRNPSEGSVCRRSDQTCQMLPME